MQLVNGTQLDLFDLLNVLETQLNPVKQGKRSVENVTEPVKAELGDGDYLEKGSRIESLAREAFSKTIKAISVSDLEQKIYAVAYDTCSNLYKHVEKVAAVIRRFIQGMTFAEDDEKYRTLQSLICFNFKIRDVALDSESYIHAVRRLRYKMKKCTDQCCLILNEDGWRPMYIYGYKSQNAGKTSYLMKDGSVVADTANVLAWLFLLSIYNRSITDEEMRGPLSEVFSGWFASGLPESFSDVWYSVSALSLRNMTGMLKATPGGVGLSGKEALLRMKGRYALPFKEYERARTEVVDEFKRILNLGDSDIPVATIKNNAVAKRNQELYKDSQGTQHYMYLLGADLEYAIVETDPVKYFDKGFGKMDYNSLLPRATHIDKDGESVTPLAWGLPTLYSMSSAKENLLKTVIKTVWEEKGQLINKLRYYKEMEPGKSVAKSYQTKKGIPQKVLKEMKESDFNNYFGYVEIDEGCELEKVRAIADEFTVFKEEYMPGFDSTGVALRFRRLGNHKALGLYYPMLGCLCVDISSPSSFIHEYGHCLDNVAGEDRRALSDGTEFFHVYILYKKALLKSLEGDETTAKRLSGNTKYNLKYYLLRTESFARCFELYVVKCLGVESSLCKQDKDLGFAYPVDSELMEGIKIYFDSLLATVNGAEQPAVAA